LVGYVKSLVDLRKWRMWNPCLKKKQISTNNHFEEEDFYPDELWNRRISSDLIHLGHLVLGFRLHVCCKLVAIWWMTNKRSFCFVIAFHSFATLENWLTYQCPSSWLVVITMKKKLAGTWKLYREYWPVQINSNKFATRKIPKKPVDVVKGRILTGWASKVSPTLPEAMNQ
jgi:hypothetical protein